MNELGNKQIMAKNIQYYMNLNNKSRREMCEALGVKYTTFTDWVNANVYPRIDKIELMANYFGIDKSDLVEDRNHKLAQRHEKDIAKKLSETLEQLNAQDGLMFDGNEMDEQTKELLKISLENALRTAKVAAHDKYTPKKYKKN